MHKYIILTLCVLSGFFLKAQVNLDSLYTVWQDQTQADSNRTKAYENYIWDGYLFSNPDTAFVLAQSLLRFGEQQQYGKAKSLAYNLMGASNYLRTDYPKALGYYQRSLKIYEEIGDKPGSARTISNIGIIYKNQGDYSKALDYYQRSLKIQEEIGDTRGSAATIGNIGSIYLAQGDNSLALDYFQHCLKVVEEIGDKQLSANTIGNIGSIYKNQGDYPKSLEYFQRSLKIYQEMGNKQGSALTIGNIGQIYTAQGNYPKALDYYQRALKIFEEIGEIYGSANIINSIGILYQTQGNYPKALEYCKKSLHKSEQITALNLEKDACQCLYETYKAMGNGNEALVYLEKKQVINDSLNAEETNRKLQQMEFQKIILQDSIAKAQEARLIQAVHQEEIRQEERTKNISIGIGALVLLLAGGLYTRLRYVRKSKAIIEKEKDRSNNLLLNILPGDIAEELKTHGKAEARDFDMVSILFTDFKGYTEASAELTTSELVREINHCFEAFDGIMEKYNIEKIKTIGDAYMAAGGLPVPNDDSVKNTVLAALEMQAFISKRKEAMDAAGKPAFEMRVGIHTGPVAAGIVGVKKFQYDIWGDTVNTASRIEGAGEVAKVNIGQVTYGLLKDDSLFTFESRGKIEAKGKGEIEMYFVGLKTEKE